MSEDRTVLEKIAFAAQSCFQQHPAVILGSGASVVHRIRGMGDLAKYLLDHVEASDGEEADAWLLIRAALANDDGLEEALLKTAAPLSLVEKIVALTWKAIATDDLAVMARAVRGEERFHLSELIHGMFKSTHMVVNIVTPNYDRVAEYASDIAGYVHATGFVPGLIRSREGADAVSIRRGAHPARTVRIWKVHGSLDWFANQDGNVVSLPISGDPPEAFEPLIVTPGVSKYERTHDEPFRSVIQGADAALGAASSFLCVGYGFRDRHIQPKIVERCRQGNVPIVILAHTLTDEAKNFLAKNAGQTFLALEKDRDGTRVFTPEYADGLTIPHADIWSFENFNKMVL
jgi:SIR2-like domain